MYQEIIVGRNAVFEVLCGTREINHVYLQRDLNDRGLVKILDKCRERNIVIKRVETRKLDEMAEEDNRHQGVAASVAPVVYCDLEDILQIAADRGEAPFVVLCDGIEDPHNLGAIIRTAECAGAHGVIFPKRRSAAVGQTVYRASAGACEHIALCRVPNLKQAIDRLKEKNIWIYCADMDGQEARGTDFSGGAAVVVGSEGSGVSPLVKKSCDVTVKLPLMGKIQSLNASVAAGIVMYEVLYSRMEKKREDRRDG